ncbi:MAG: hypothetical protein ACM3S1_00275 [Hyphomicrobiales bacterium]
MPSRIWELHGMQLQGAIRSTPDGEADIDGLVLSEKAYLLAIRDFRPQHLLAMVREHGPLGACEQLVAHYGSADSQQLHAGRTLVTGRGLSPGPYLVRNDEVGDPASLPGRL